LAQIEFVKEVHELHVWSISLGKPTLSVHLVIDGEQEQVLKQATALCRNFGISHTSIQIEDAKKVGTLGYINCEHNLH
jgi:zinc transporter 2